MWYAPEFLSNCSTCVPVAAPGRTGSPGKRICLGTLSQKTRNIDPSGRLRMAMWPLRGPACARLRSGTWPARSV